jgi:hypothetical protein
MAACVRVQNQADDVNKNLATSHHAGCVPSLIERCLRNFIELPAHKSSTISDVLHPSRVGRFYGRQEGESQAIVQIGEPSTCKSNRVIADPALIVRSNAQHVKNFCSRTTHAWPLHDRVAVVCHFRNTPSCGYEQAQPYRN